MRPPQFQPPALLADAWVVVPALVFWLLLAVVMAALLLPVAILHYVDKAWRWARG